MSLPANVANSFRFAGRGLRLAGRDRNMRIMLSAAVATVALACVFNVSTIQWAILLVCIGGVLSAEVMNTAVERLADQIERRYDANIRDIKDVAAGAVLLASMVALAAGALIFWPHVVG